MGENCCGIRLFEAGGRSACGENALIRTNRAAARSRWRNWRMPSSAGFTLLELVVTLVVVGILAVVAIARLDTKEFDARGYFDQTQGMVRYAQKLAVARRGLIYVDFTGAFRICVTPNSATCSCSSPLTAPSGAIKPLPSGVTLGAGTAAFCFDSAGRPLLTTLAPMAGANTVTVTSAGVRTFLIEPETGYVH